LPKEIHYHRLANGVSSLFCGDPWGLGRFSPPKDSNGQIQARKKNVNKNQNAVDTTHVTSETVNMDDPTVGIALAEGAEALGKFVLCFSATWLVVHTTLGVLDKGTADLPRHG